MFSPVGKMNFLNGNFRNFLLKSARTFCSEATQVANVTEGSTSVILPPKAPLVNIGDRKFPFMNNLDKPKQVWVENFDAVQENKLGIIELHPEVFGVMPRIDLIHDNIKWQRNYRRVSFANTKVRAEVRGGGRKPWPQKGQGRSRHGSIRSPLFRGGGVVHGPRSPTSYFYMLPFYQRVLGLTSTLSVKLAQDDLHVVPNLEIPSDDPQYLEDMIEARNWGVSVLLIDDTDIMPRNITVATEGVKHVNLMPVYGLNVYSMLKHETLVLTLSAVERLEERLLYQLNRVDATEKGRKFKPNQV